MRFYLAAAYSRRAEAQAFMEQIEALGHDCNSTWLKGPEEQNANTIHGLEEQWKEWANRDILEVAQADCLVLLSLPRGQAKSTGAYIEAGMMYQRCGPRRVFVVGPVENVFFALTPSFETKEQFLEYVKGGNDGWRLATPMS